MTVKEAMKELQSLSNEKMLAMNVKNGAGKNQYGVKLGDIRNVAKKIKIDHELGLELWKTKNIEAQLLACLIMKPKLLSIQDLNDLAASIDFVYVTEWFYSYVVKEHPEKEKLREKWMSSKNPFLARMGWSLMAGRVAREPEGLDMKDLLSHLEKNMPKANPTVQWTMNNTLINVGIYHPKQRERAIAIGEKLGILRDYPVSKGCTSPFAPIAINELVKRQGK